MKAQELGFKLTNDTPEMKSILSRIKELEHAGYEFEAAEARSRCSSARRSNIANRRFNVDAYHVSMRRDGQENPSAKRRSRSTSAINARRRWPKATAR